MNFVNKINKKKFKNLDYNIMLFIQNIDCNVKDSDILYCNLKKGNYKTDIELIINKKIYKLSIKKGNKNSVHSENIYNFIKTLKELGLSEISINNFLLFHFGDNTLNGTGNTRYSAEEMKTLYKNNLISLNYELNNNMIIRKYIIKQFILGQNEIDYLIYGIPENFIWLSKKEIIELIMEYKCDSIKLSPHISVLTIQNLNRCLNGNKTLESRRFKIQIKWYNIYDDILKYKIK